MSDAENNSKKTETPTDGKKRSKLWIMLGLKHREGKRIAIGLTLWGWVVLMVLLGGIGGVGFAEYSMQPDFCRSCHVMEPYYTAWHESTHKDVNCVDCHFEPGLQNTLKGKFEASTQAVKFITGTYGTKPHAQVRDVSCLRGGCHEKRILEGKVEWTVTSQRGRDVTIHFDHTPHLKELRRGKSLRCVSCHSQMVQGKHIAVTLDTCFNCHFKGMKHGRDEEVIGGCGSCHGAPKGTIRLATGDFDHKQYLDKGVECQNCHADVVKGDGEVPMQQCWSCHNDPLHIAQYGQTSKIHEKHIADHKIECNDCHIQIEHHLTAGLPRQASLMSVGHMQQDAGSCGKCHINTHTGPREIYAGVGGRGVPDMPSPMFRTQVDCIACHDELKNNEGDSAILGQTYIAAQRRCDYCHEHRYDGVLDEWKAQVTGQLVVAKDAYAKAEQAITQANLDSEKWLEVRRLLDDAAHNIRMVELGHGVHNVIYSQALLNVAGEYCEQVLQHLTTEIVQ